MQAFWFLLQFIVPLAAILWLAWRFLLVPAIQRTQEKIAQEEHDEKARRRIEAAFADDPGQAIDKPSADEEIDRAIGELRGKDNK